MIADGARDDAGRPTTGMVFRSSVFLIGQMKNGAWLSPRPWGELERGELERWNLACLRADFLDQMPNEAPRTLSA